MAKKDMDQPPTQQGGFNDRNDEFGGTGADDVRGIAEEESDEFEEDEEDVEDLDEEEDQE